MQIVQDVKPVNIIQNFKTKPLKLLVPVKNNNKNECKDMEVGEIIENVIKAVSNEKVKLMIQVELGD